MLPNVGAQELLIIFVIALVIVGPRKLPELGRALGRGLNELKKLQDEVRDMVKFDLNDDAVESTPRMSLPAESEAVAEPAETVEPAPEPETQAADDEPWIYDVMDDDEPDVTQPPVGSVE